ncbi:MAG: hypothetical protein ACLU9S_21415 [Oscillospiraceae bacterium]
MQDAYGKKGGKPYDNREIVNHKQGEKQRLGKRNADVQKECGGGDRPKQEFDRGAPVRDDRSQSLPTQGEAQSLAAKHGDRYGPLSESQGVQEGRVGQKTRRKGGAQKMQQNFHHSPPLFYLMSRLILPRKHITDNFWVRGFLCFIRLRRT